MKNAIVTRVLRVLRGCEGDDERPLSEEDDDARPDRHGCWVHQTPGGHVQEEVGPVNVTRGKNRWVPRVYFILLRRSRCIMITMNVTCNVTDMAVG